MRAKKVLINIFTNEVPSRITFFSQFGRTIFDGVITQNNFRFCFCTNLCQVAVRVEHNNQVQTQYYYLTNCPCQHITASYRFNTITDALQTFFLRDANYNLPVQSAILNFTAESSNIS